MLFFSTVAGEMYKQIELNPPGALSPILDSNLQADTIYCTAPEMCIIILVDFCNLGHICCEDCQFRSSFVRPE
jgi:hypothetical protein